MSPCITDVLRIDYPGLCDRREEGPLGLLIHFEHLQTILRVNIGNTGQDIEYAFQNRDELNFFLREYYGVLVTDPKLTQKLSHLIGLSIISIDLGYYPKEEPKIRGVHFELLSGEVVAIQLCLSDSSIFTFYNNGDEGCYSFSIPYRPAEFAFGDVFWRKLHATQWMQFSTYNKS